MKYFVLCGVFDIDGLGDKIIVEFFGFGWLYSFVDIFCLKLYCNEFLI